jgi:hypothetical protein
LVEAQRGEQTDDPVGNALTGFGQNMMLTPFDVVGDVKAPAHLLEKPALLGQAEVFTGKTVRHQIARS